MDPNSFHAKILGSKVLPISIKRLILVSASWTFRGTVFYMDRTEKAFAIVLEILTFLALGVALIRFTGFYTGLFLAFVITHTLHWLFNGQVFLLFKNLGFTRIEREQFIKYAKALQQRITKQRFLSAAAIFGSLSRGKLKETSDLDVHIIRRSGVVNGLKACIFTLLERARAFLNGFPLDVYTLDDLRNLSKLRSDEPPIILYDPDEKLVKKYQHFFYFDEITTKTLGKG